MNEEETLAQLKQFYEERLDHLKTIVPTMSNEELSVAIAVESILLAMLEQFTARTRGMSREDKALVVANLRRHLEAML
jgi:hypothetical protein